LHYQPPPWEPWLITAQTLAARLPTRPAATLPLAALLLLALLGWGLATSGEWRVASGEWRVASGEHHERGNTQHVTRNTSRVSRFTFHVSRFTFHVSRFTQPPGLLFALLITLLHGWLWLWIVPPWQGPDEPQHYAAAALWAR